jgi:hypothetical protein
VRRHLDVQAAEERAVRLSAARQLLLLLLLLLLLRLLLLRLRLRRRRLPQ